MRKTTQKLNASELLELLNSQWASVNDIRLIGNVGLNTARSIKKEIVMLVEDTGKKLPPNLVPMEYVIHYFNINIQYLRKISRQ